MSEMLIFSSEIFFDNATLVLLALSYNGLFV